MDVNPEVAVTTTDNPYNPLTDFDRWDNYDRMQGYGTSEYLARVVRTTTEFGEGTYAEDIDRAVNEIVLLNLISWTHPGISYKKVVGSPEPEVATA